MLLVVCIVRLVRVLAVICDGFDGFFADELLLDVCVGFVSLGFALTSRFARIAFRTTNASNISGSMNVGFGRSSSACNTSGSKPYRTFCSLGIMDTIIDNNKTKNNRAILISCIFLSCYQFSFALSLPRSLARFLSLSFKQSSSLCRGTSDTIENSTQFLSCFCIFLIFRLSESIKSH